MKIESLDDLNPPARLKVALLFAENDSRLRTEVAEKDKKIDSTAVLGGVREIVSEGGENVCESIRRQLLRTFKGSKAKPLVMVYHQEMARWVRKESDLPFAPTQRLLSLPPLDESSLDLYLAELIRVQGVLAEKEKDEGIEMSIMNGERLNVEYCLESFIKKGDQEALRMMVCLLQKPAIAQTDQMVRLLAASYQDIFNKALVALKSNPHVMGCLVQLMSEEVKRLAAGEPLLAGRHAFTLILTGFQAAGILMEVGPEDFGLVEPGKPREHCHFTFRIMQGDGGLKTLAIPVEFLPAEWNEHRLVDPRKSAAFKAWGSQVAKKAAGLEEVYEDAMARFKEALLKERTYALDIARLEAPDLPAPEGGKVWLHYFYDEDMPRGYIGVEVILEDAKGQQSSMAYVMNRELEFEPWPIKDLDSDNAFFHPVIPQNTGALDRVTNDHIGPTSSIEHLYITQGPELYQWPEPTEREAVERVLRYYLAEYASCLLVHRGKDERPSDSVRPRGKSQAELGFSLQPSRSVIRLPALPGEKRGVRGERGGRQMTVFHRKGGYVRRLPAGHRASQEALALAEAATVYVPPGSTFVQGPKNTSGILDSNLVSPTEIQGRDEERKGRKGKSKKNKR